ncbi:MAG: bifunctional enoyl-CoA hydratase/phosphate acetyltransferase [Rubrivivax sp.]
MEIDLRDEWLENTTFDELAVGQSATMRRALTDADIAGFAAISGDLNPTHLDDRFAREEGLAGRTAHGMWSGALVSTVLGTVFPGPGTRYVSQRMDFHGTARSGDVLEVRVAVRAKDAASGRVTLDCSVRRQDGTLLMDGLAVVEAPRHKERVRKATGLRWHVFDAAAGVRSLIEQAARHAGLRCAVVHPCDPESLRGALDAAHHGLFTPVLVAPRERLQATAEAAGLSLAGVEIEDVRHSHAAAERAAEMAAEGAVQALMKGSLHTDEVMKAVLSRAELRTERRISHVFRFDAPAYHKPLLVTDAAMNIAPTLNEKAHIVQNAIDLARVLGVDLPKVAVLAAVEGVNPKMACTLDAAALCKMADRGQIRGGIVDGPLAFDNAISAEAARTKGIVSPVAGDPDILMVPDLVSGNILAKQLEYLGGAVGSGIVLGARVPIALTSRADGATARLASAALAVLVAQAQSA